MEGFAKEQGIQFPENATREDKVSAVAQQYDAWVQYRANQVTTFVGQVREMVTKKHADVLLSTAVFPEQGKSFGDKKQDFNTWLARGYLDIITPMAYYDDIATLKNALEGMLPKLSECYCYAGISPTYHNLSNERVLAQIQTAIETGAEGFVFFGSQSILNNQGYIDLLAEKYEGQTAVLPHNVKPEQPPQETTPEETVPEATEPQTQPEATQPGKQSTKLARNLGLGAAIAALVAAAAALFHAKRKGKK